MRNKHPIEGSDGFHPSSGPMNSWGRLLVPGRRTATFPADQSLDSRQIQNSQSPNYYRQRGLVVEELHWLLRQLVPEIRRWVQERRLYQGLTSEEYGHIVGALQPTRFALGGMYHMSPHKFQGVQIHPPQRIQPYG